MLSILQPFCCDQADSEQGQFPALDELLGSLHSQCPQMPECLQPAVGCFASQLEQDIAALEAGARCVDTVDWEAPAGDDVLGSCATGIGKAYSIDVDSCGRDQAASDSDSDEEWELPAVDVAPATIPAVSRIARRRGKPVKHGAWQGCCKSAWCDREDRHRGLCNHKATVPGPTVSTPQSEDACSTDNQAAACCAHPAQQELSSGGHSHNCSKSQETADGDEREVASAFKSGCGIQQSHSVQEVSMPFSCLPQLQQQPQRQQLPPSPKQQRAAAVWGSSSDSQLAAAEQQEQEQQLFAMPAVYQARVKDLEAPDISSMLSGEEGLCSLESEATAIAVPVVEPVQMEAATVETSCHTAIKHALSTPSSPSCVSAAARTESGAFSRPTVTLLLPATLAPAAAVVAVPSACMRGMLALEQVHPTISSNAAAKRAAQGLGAAAGAGSVTDAGPALKRAKSATAEAVLRRCSSSGSSGSNEAAAAALAAAAPSPASVCKAAASSGHKPSAAKAPKAAAGTDAAAAAPAAPAVGASAADPKLPPPMARAQRIKQRPRRPDDPPRPLLDLSSSSPSKISFCNKKRPAARMAPAPTTGHSCSQCGATSTPVWRAGPAGPKTLCNACGVRYMKTSKRK